LAFAYVIEAQFIKDYGTAYLPIGIVEHRDRADAIVKGLTWRFRGGKFRNALLKAVEATLVENQIKGTLISKAQGRLFDAALLVQQLDKSVPRLPPIGRPTLRALANQAGTLDRLAEYASNRESPVSLPPAVVNVEVGADGKVQFKPGDPGAIEEIKRREDKARDELSSHIAAKQLEALARLRTDGVNQQPPSRIPELSTAALNPKQLKALEIIRADGPIQGKALAKRIDRKESTLRKHIIPALKPFGVKNDNDGDGYYVAPRSAV
jgi:hypothetical protein